VEEVEVVEVRVEVEVDDRNASVVWIEEEVLEKRWYVVV
jgi:hypothetical protein